ncbi:MAG TPA: VOC family protein [Terracidiphilus sp.]|nr:VOC family protein [Terracidiphilus sp.]
MNPRPVSILIAALAVAAAAIHSHAQQPSVNAEIDGIAHVAYRVTNLDAEVAFFKKLGYEEAFSRTQNGKTSQAFIKVNDRQFIEVYPQTNPGQPLGWMHVCYESADLNALHDLYVTRGLDASHVVKAGAGNLIFSLRDPDGRTTEFTQYMPGSMHSDDRGKHLGAARVSDEMLGFDLPVADLGAARTFYKKLGFEVEDAGSGIRMTAPNAPDLHIEVHTARPNERAQMLFLVPDARIAADDLRAQGLGVKRVKGLVFVHDPDGNAFVFLEANPQ